MCLFLALYLNLFRQSHFRIPKMDTIPNVVMLSNSPLSAFYYQFGCSYWVLGDKYRCGFLRYRLWSPSSKQEECRACLPICLQESQASGLCPSWVLIPARPAHSLCLLGDRWATGKVHIPGSQLDSWVAGMEGNRIKANRE